MTGPCAWSRPASRRRRRPSSSRAWLRARPTCTRWVSPGTRTPAWARRANSACPVRSTPTRRLPPTAASAAPGGAARGGGPTGGAGAEMSWSRGAAQDPPAAQRQAARHHLAHLQFITPRDMGRFAALGAVANFQPLWATADPQMEELTIPFVGAERAAWQYQIGSLVRQGTRIAFGSDWPVSSADPLQEIHVAVNRVLSDRLGRRGEPECEVPFQP